MADELFRTAPAEVVRYFRAKRSMPSFDWRDVAPQEHAFSWTVAKSMENDVLEDIRAAVDDAIVNRVPFDAFRERLTPILQQKGWWGRGIQTDPKDGVPKVVQLGSPRRLRTIYWANTTTAHAAGEWERTQRNKRFLPFLIYTLSHAEHRREEHERWVGFIAPVDDPIWDRIYPPNGWLCQCGVRQISQREAERLGWRPDGPPIQLVTRPWRNKRTGETIHVPVGVDPGWDTNPGKHRERNVSEFLHGNVAALTPNRQRVAIEDIVGSPILQAFADGKMPDGSFMPVAQLTPSVVEAYGAHSNLVTLSAASARHILHDYPDRNIGIDSLRLALAVIAAPAGIIRADGAALYYGVAGGRWWRVGVKPVVGKREWWLNHFVVQNAKRTQKRLANARDEGRLIE